MTEKPAKAGRQQDGRFRKGASGNPQGRPFGSRHKTTLAVEGLLDGDAEKLTRAAIDRAIAGDPAALRICLDRIIPPRRERTIDFALASALAGLVASAARAIEVSELEERLSKLEASLGTENRR
jgi:hypothetical protein